VAEPERQKRSTGAGPYGPPGNNLIPGHTYFDLDHPELGPFIATGDEEIAPDANIVDQDDVPEESWESLVAEGWGETRPGAGDRAYDQGAYGQESNPRMPVRNAAPPGVGEGLTPRENPEEEGSS